MKILFIAPKYSGGIGGHAARVAEKLQEHGFDIKLMSIEGQRGLQSPSRFHKYVRTQFSLGSTTLVQIVISLRI